MNPSDYSNSLNQARKFQKKVNILCQHCREYLCGATEALCGHVFCEVCIKKYLIFLDACPKCEMPLRKTTLYRNIHLDNIVEDYVKSMDPRNVSSFRERLEALRLFRRDLQVENPQQGMKVDIRDNSYVWCVGVLRKIL